MHFKKLKSSAVGHMNEHYTREYVQMDGHIDIKKTKDNIYLDGSSELSSSETTKNIFQRIKERLGDKTMRKDATVMVDLIVTQPKELGSEYDPKFFETMNSFFQKEFGKENQIYSVVHLDEATPHLHYSFIPFTKDNRLCCKEILTRKFLKEFHQKAEKETGYKLTMPEDDRKKNLSLEDFKKLMELKKEKEQAIKQYKYWQLAVEEKKNEMKLLDKEYDNLSNQLNLIASKNASECSVLNETKQEGINIPPQKEKSNKEIFDKYKKILEEDNGSQAILSAKEIKEKLKKEISPALSEPIKKIVKPKIKDFGL